MTRETASTRHANQPVQAISLRRNERFDITYTRVTMYLPTKKTRKGYSKITPVRKTNPIGILSKVPLLKALTTKKYWALSVASEY